MHNGEGSRPLAGTVTKLRLRNIGRRVDAPRLQIWDAALAADCAAWIEHWNSWPDREVFAHPGYLRLFQTDADSVMCACYAGPVGKVLYPFLLRDLSSQPFWDAADGPAADVTTPMGYGGPVAWDVVDRPSLMTDFWQAFDRWAKGVGIVSEFARLSLFQQTLIDDPRYRQFRQHNVVRSLTPTESELWMDFRHKVRKNVQRARAARVRVEIDLNCERLDEFMRIYEATMERRKANASFHFDRAFFIRLRNQLHGQFALFNAFSQERVISTELVLISATNVYSWLGGTDEHCFEMRPNDLLKYEIMLWAKEAGKSRFVLGGGFQPNDGVFNYKLSFAPSGVVDFNLRKRIVDAERYRVYADRKAALVSARETVVTDPDFFPAYCA